MESGGEVMVSERAAKCRSCNEDNLRLSNSFHVWSSLCDAGPAYFQALDSVISGLISKTWDVSRMAGRAGAEVMSVRIRREKKTTRRQEGVIPTIDEPRRIASVPQT
jgi:hypothetical protein